MKTNGCPRQYPEYWGQQRRPVEDAANMRDDSFNLASMRMFPETVFSPASASSPASPARTLAAPGAAPAGRPSNFAAELARASKLKARGQLGLLDRGWLSMHNYTHNHPIQERADTDGFFKFRAYHKILHDALGRDLPIIGTEGGTFVGEHEDTTLPAVDSATAVSMASQAYRYMRDQREPWNFAYSFWTIANEAGGGSDKGFSDQALFNADGTASPIVGALRTLG